MKKHALIITGNPADVHILATTIGLTFERNSDKELISYKESHRDIKQALVDARDELASKGLDPIYVNGYFLAIPGARAWYKTVTP